MAKLLQVGISYPWELASGIGHVACTLGGVNYESKGSAGILKGSAARSAANGLFKHQFHLVLTDAQAAAAKRYADAQVGERYRWGGVPGDGGDCSGYVSGIICAALGRPIERLFATGNWRDVNKGLGFKPGLKPKGAVVAPKEDPNVPISKADAERIAEAVWTRKSPRVKQSYDYLARRASAAQVGRDTAYQALALVRQLVEQHGGRPIDEDVLARGIAQLLLPSLAGDVKAAVQQAIEEFPDDQAELIADAVVDRFSERLRPPDAPE
jgi:hypothetical protein